MVQVYVFPNYLNVYNNSNPTFLNYWGYASTPNGIVYGVISAMNTFLSFAGFSFIPSTYTYNGSTYYTYKVEVTQSNTLLTYPALQLPNTNPQIYDNVVYYASGNYIYAYDLISGSTIGSVLSSILPALIDTRDGMIFGFNLVYPTTSVIYYTSLQYPILNSLASWSSVVVPYNFYWGYTYYPPIVANGSLYIAINDTTDGNTELVFNANNPNEYTAVSVPVAPSSQYNGSLYAIQNLSNGLNEVYVYNSALNVVASYFLPQLYNFDQYITVMTSDYGLISNFSYGLYRTDIYNIVSGSAISLYIYSQNPQNVAYSNKYGIYLISIYPLTILVPDNPLAIDVYTSSYANNKIYIIASVSIANAVPVSSYLVRFYYSSIPNYGYYIGWGAKSTVYGAVHQHDVLQYIGSSYTNASGLASILFTLPNTNQKLYYYVEVEQEV